MTSLPAVGDLAFVGPSHISEFNHFQYVEVVGVHDSTVTAMLVGPDVDDEEEPEKLFSISQEKLVHRCVSTNERDLWPGSYLAHPVAFARASSDGVQEWSYGVVSGYDVTELSATLHIVCVSDSVRLSLSSTTPVIKADVLNYALQTGTAVNTAAVTPTELVEQQNKIITSCSRRRSGLPKDVTDSLTVPFNGDEIIPLIRPASLQLVRVRRQHIVNYKTAARTKRPDDLYVDQAAVQVAREKKSRVRASTTKVAGVDSDALDIANSDNDSAASMLSGSSDEENVREVQHMHRPLTKRRRVELSDVNSDISSSSEFEDTGLSRSRHRGVAFQSSTTDQRVHAAVVRRRHTGKEPQMLLQSLQHSQHIDFIATPPVLRGVYQFGFGVGLAIMHFRRAHPRDEMDATEKGVNMWYFSSRNTLSPPAPPAGLEDLVGALSCLHKFAKIFYNKDTRKFIGVARDFVISYANTASDDSGVARLLTHWINTKFSKFRNRLVTKSLRSALRVKKQFKRNDEELVALKEALPSWKTAASAAVSQRSSSGETSSRLTKQADHRHSTKSKIPPSVISSLPKSPDGRRLCMRYVSKIGCNNSDCARGHFKPATLTDETKAVISQRWRGLADEFKDL